MAHSKIPQSVKMLTNGERDEAQENLNNLCDKYHMNRINLTHGKSEWRELCYRMIGIPYTIPNKVGRKERSEDDVWAIGNSIMCSIEFEKSDGKKLLVKKAIDDAVKDFQLKEKNYESGRQQSPEQVIRGVLYNKFPELEKKLAKERQEEDWSDLPDEYYRDFYKNNPPKKPKKK